MKNEKLFDLIRNHCEYCGAENIGEELVDLIRTMQDDTDSESEHEKHWQE